MIDQDKRMAVFQLHLKGRGQREISRLLEISRNTVLSIIANEGKRPVIIRKDTTFFDEEELRKLYVECEGRIQRIHEILVERDQVRVGYSTLSRKLRELGLGRVKKSRCERVPDVPGEEMQHDTTIYFVKLGSQKVKLVASLLYFRYCKIRYLKFYRNFNRFRILLIQQVLALSIIQIWRVYGEVEKPLLSSRKWSGSPLNTDSDLSAML